MSRKSVDADGLVFCSQPKQCVWQHTCRRNLDNWRGPMPAVRVYQTYLSPPDQRCPGFLELSAEFTAAQKKRRQV